MFVCLSYLIHLLGLLKPYNFKCFDLFWCINFVLDQRFQVNKRQMCRVKVFFFMSKHHLGKASFVIVKFANIAIKLAFRVHLHFAFNCICETGHTCSHSTYPLCSLLHHPASSSFQALSTLFPCAAVAMQCPRPALKVSPAAWSHSLGEHHLSEAQLQTLCGKTPEKSLRNRKQRQQEKAVRMMLSMEMIQCKDEMWY